MPPPNSCKRKDRIRTNRAMEIALTRPHQSRIAMRGAARIRMPMVMSTDFATCDGVGGSVVCGVYDCEIPRELLRRESV
jgi:hypothetical protein